MSVNATVLAALEPEVAAAIAGGAVYTDVEAAQVSLAISLVKLHSEVAGNITPAVQTSAEVATKTAATQEPTAASYPTGNVTAPKKLPWRLQE